MVVIRHKVNGGMKIINELRNIGRVKPIITETIVN